ncbi:hypothetical protein NQ176_g8274 [Zarea fungicola]|uniref:Uncharacterized protein n=1 Tax=Zarea fungicola TaxID=93591 RepID=A0ACC1MU45_9HYPO|nr:hypothetical protein NQ176_g8274 [Lecanicillium fungicola]
MDASPQLSIDFLPAWAKLQDVQLTKVGMQHIDRKGYGLVSGDGLRASDDVKDVMEIIRIPAGLVLSAATVEEYAKVDHNFKELLDAAGRKSTRLDIMLYLLVQMVSGKHAREASTACVPTSWSEYIKFLPQTIPVPTLWSESHKLLLQGTTLEEALEAKMTTLNSEFARLRDNSSDLPFWYSLLWERNGAVLSDWLLVDAWYRSRCLELPQASHAMVPALDMVNHSATATAYYEEEASGDVSLRIRPGLQVAAGQEISISYGDSKSAAEMLFSYGFIDPDSKTRELTLHLDGFPDDPLAMAKLRVFGGAPTVTFRQAEPDRSGSSCMLWESGFVHLMCLNEEDGLEFCILQDDAGDRQLRVLWQDEDVTDRADRFEKLLDGHPLQALFQLRSVSVVQQQAATQLDKLNVAPDAELLEPLISAGLVDQNYVNLVAELRDSERLMLETAVAELEREKLRLVQDKSVVAYFGSKEDGQNELEQHGVSPSSANDCVDFS